METNNIPATGWAAIDRGLLNHWIWTGERYTRGQAWVELILLAAWSDTTVLYRGQPVQKHRGQVRASIGWLADRWGWNRKTVTAFLDTLAAEGMADVEKGPAGTVITLSKYADYQPGTGQPKRQTTGQPNGQPEAVDHGQPKTAPPTLEELRKRLTSKQANGHP